MQLWLLFPLYVTVLLEVANEEWHFVIVSGNGKCNFGRQLVCCTSKGNERQTGYRQTQSSGWTVSAEEEGEDIWLNLCLKTGIENAGMVNGDGKFHTPSMYENRKTNFE